MSDIYHLYKPLRNLLRGYDLGSGLMTCYRFFQYLDFDQPLPPYLANPRILTRTDRWRFGLLQWEFEILLREVILNSPHSGGRSLSNWKDVAKAINKIKWLENEKWGATSRHDDDVLYELVRIAHRQFPWQVGFSSDHISRYFWLYSQQGLSEVISADFGMSVGELYQIAFSLTGHFLSKPIADLPINNQVNRVPHEQVRSFIDRISIDLDTLRQEYKEYAEYNINWPYTFNPLRKYPLIRLNNAKILCPIPSFLIRRVTNEIYFDLLAHQDLFSRSFGPAVQAMIGKAAAHVAGEGGLQVKGEERFGSKKSRKDSIDWIISDGTGHLFVECKAARVHFRGVSDLTDQANIIDEFTRVKTFALQAYKTLSLALDGQYPHWQKDGNPLFVMIVTLEDWQSFGLHVDRHILTPLKEDLLSVGIAPDLVDRFPLTFCAIADFEAAMHVVKQVGIDAVFCAKTSGEYPQWALGSFLRESFPEQLGNWETSAFHVDWDEWSSATKATGSASKISVV